MSFIFNIFSLNLRIRAGWIILFGMSFTVLKISAATFHWDGITGGWDTNTNWSTAIGATTPDPAGVPIAGDSVNFNNTAVNGAETISLNADQAAQFVTFKNTGTTTIDGNTAGSTARNLTLSGGSLALNAGAGAVTMGGNGLGITISTSQTWTNNSTSLFTISANIVNGAATQLTIAGPGDTLISGVYGPNGGSISKVGTGTLTLSGVNTYTGATSIGTSILAGGTLRMSGAGVLGTGVVLVTDGTLDLNGTTQTAGNSVTMGGGASGSTGAITLGTGTLSLTNGLIYSATNNPNGAVISGVGGGRLQLSGGANPTFTINNSTGAADDLTISAIIQDGTRTGLIKANAGTMVLSGANTYTGTTAISAGVLNIQNATALGTTAAGTTVANNSALQIQGGITVGAEALTLNGAGVSTDGALRNISGANDFGGVVTLGSAARINSDAGTLTLSNAGTMTGAGLGLTVGGAGDTVINSIIGTVNGTLTKDGAGTLTLTGANTTTGLATVSNGILVVGTAAGGSWTGGVTVDSGGTLKGRGNITGAVTINSGGTYSPGNSPSIQTVGSLTLNAGSNSIFEIDGSTAGNGAGFYDRIVVTGAATINGGTITTQTIFSGSSGFTPTAGQIFTVISAGSLTGQFTTIDNTGNVSGLTFIPQYTGTSVILIASLANFSSTSSISLLNLNPSQIAIAVPLDQIRPAQINSSPGHTMTDAEKIYQSLGRLTAAQIPSAISQMSPEKLGAMPKLSQSVGSQMHSVVKRQLDLRHDWNSSQGGLSIYSRNGQMVYEPVAGVLADNLFVFKKRIDKLSYFASVNGEQGEVKPSENRTNFDYWSTTAVYGMNYALGPAWNFGFFAGYGHSDTSLGGSGGEILYNSGRIGGYVSWSEKDWFVEWGSSIGKGFYDTERNITFLGEKAKGEAEGWETTQELRIGKDLSFGKWTLTPSILGRYSRTWVDAYDETGSAARLNIDSLDQQSAVTGARLNLQRAFPLGKTSVVPRVFVNYEREWVRSGVIDAKFAAGGDRFRIYTDPIDPDQLTTGVGSSWILSDRLQWDLAWEMEALQNDLARQSVNLSCKFGF